MINATFRPLETWPRKQTPSHHRKGGQFRSTQAQTLDLLEAELERLCAKDIVIQIAVTLKDIRNDGWPRADARPTMPGVVLNFTSRGRAMQFACDTYTNWQANLRAIGLTLEALRAVDRYGATQSGEQYTGFSALPPGEGYVPPKTPVLTLNEAVALLARLSRFTAGAILADAAVADLALQDARKRSHPDAGGGHEAFLEVHAAAKVLQAHHSRQPAGAGVR